MNSTTHSSIQPHDERPAAVWSSGAKRYEEISEPSAQAAWSTFSTGYGPTKSLAMSLDPNRLGEFRDDFIAFHETFATELGICVPREYLLTVGVR